MKAKRKAGREVPLGDLHQLGLYDLFSMVARSHGATLKEVFSSSQCHHAAAARGEAMAYVRTKFNWSYEKIAAFFGRNDHKTVMLAIARHGVSSNKRSE